MAKDEPMPHYERLLAAASSNAGRHFLGHAVVRRKLKLGESEAAALSVIPVWTSPGLKEPDLLRFMRQIFGPRSKV